MYDEQTRINATISYLFLGPIFLLAKKGTPLAEKYVQDHAKRASILILASFGMYMIYYTLGDLLSVSLFGISIASVVLAIIVTLILAILLHGAYFAFSGREANSLKLGEIFISRGMDHHILENEKADASGYTDEEKIRIVASFLPFVGIWLASRYDKNEIVVGKKVGSFSVMLIMLISILIGNTGLTILLSILYIGLIVITLVGLFIQKQFFMLGIYQFIPTYREFEIHIFASVKYSFMFLRVIFGGIKDFTYQDIYQQFLEKNSNPATNPEGQAPYFMPLWVVGIPIINIITVPSYWNPTYIRYRALILQGVTLTILFGFSWFLYGWNSSIPSILLFPIIHLIAYAPRDADTSAPIVSLGISLIHLLQKSRDNLSDSLAEKEEKVSFTYEPTPETQETEEKIANL